MGRWPMYPEGACKLGRNSGLGFGFACSEAADRVELGQEEVRELQPLLGARKSLPGPFAGNLALRSSGKTPVLAASNCTVFSVMAGLRFEDARLLLHDIGVWPL
mmetsp:Transcript_3903/g.12620  ORF Transcript_3903/g.12620 Transcript_3903/m.12620 type:complete len:104 (-) Transcript_3903:96-407(-)